MASAPRRSAAKRQAPPTTTKRIKVDWDAVERDYRTGKFTLRELGSKYHTSHQTVQNHVKDGGWTQDLSIAIKQATNALLVKEIVDREIDRNGQSLAVNVLAAAEVNKNVILGHRGDLRATRNVANDLLDELANSALLAQEQELLAQILAGEGAEPVDVARARATVRKALEVHSRIQSVKGLAETFTKLQAAERLAHNIETGQSQGEDDPMARLMELIDGSKLPIRHE